VPDDGAPAGSPDDKLYWVMSKARSSRTVATSKRRGCILSGKIPSGCSGAFVRHYAVFGFHHRFHHFLKLKIINSEEVKEVRVMEIISFHRSPTGFMVSLFSGDTAEKYTFITSPGLTLPQGPPCSEPAIGSCVRQVQQKGHRHARLSEAAGAERSP
jgi:hypothetical protein